MILRNFLGGLRNLFVILQSLPEVLGNVPVILGNRSDTSGKHFRGYFGQAARSFAAMSLYSASDSFLLGAGVPGAFPPKEGMT